MDNSFICARKLIVIMCVFLIFMNHLTLLFQKIIFLLNVILNARIKFYFR